MSWLVFDCPSGISGDMTLGALVDLGVPIEHLRDTLATLPVHGWALRAETVQRSSIRATRVHVDIETAPPGGGATFVGKGSQRQGTGGGREPGHEHDHEHGSGHGHEHGPAHAHAHEHEPGAGAGHAHGPAVHLDDVVRILQAGRLTERALGWAVEVFRRLAGAEAAVHGVPVSQVHFHEVGAVDAVVDIAGACVGLDWLCSRRDVSGFRVSQLRVGRGQVRTEHGTMPVPPPATLRLLEGFPVQWSDVDGERVTPTGAALVAVLMRPLDGAAVRVRATGYGAGSHEFADVPNVLRALLCDPEAVAAERPGAASAAVAPAAAPDHLLRRGRVAVLHTTIDDMVPEFFGHVMARLFASGALDVVFTPVFMKKSRPATQVTVIAEPADAERLAAVLLNESSTLGVRLGYEERLELERRVVNVRTPYGDIQVKVAVRPDGRQRAVPEYESVREAAVRAGVPLADVYQAALRAELDGPV
jgi:uncharacterized protein (TIGR00299 family) protein